MTIPYVTDIRKQYLSQKKDKLNKVLDDRRHNRIKWDEDKRNRYNDDLTNLKKAHDNIVFHIKDEIVNQAKTHISKKKFNLMNPQYIDKIDTNKFDVDTVYKGFYNPKRKLFNRLMHYEAGIEKTAFEQIKEEMKEYGYILKDLSDISKSKNILIEIELDY